MSGVDREALAEVARVITASLKGRHWNDATPLHFAGAILASDWLAQVKAITQRLGPRGAVAVEDLIDRADAIDGGAQ